MEDRIGEQLAAFDRLYKEMDEGYHLYAKGRGLSDTALWLLYSLYERGAAQSQRELCSAWHYPPQTVNSAIKALEERGLVELAPIPGTRKEARMAENAGAAQVALTPQEVAALDQALDAMSMSPVFGGTDLSAHAKEGAQ